jgi:hypothetical protein
LVDVPPVIKRMFEQNPTVPAVAYVHEPTGDYAGLSLANKRGEVQILASRVSPGKPAIVGGSADKNARIGHAVVVERIAEGRVYIVDPGVGSAYSASVDDFVAWWDGDSVFAIS